MASNSEIVYVMATVGLLPSSDCSRTLDDTSTNRLAAL